MDIQKTLENHLKSFSTAPFLFIGSGFSRRYLKTEDWAVAAQLLAEDFHEIWFNNAEFEVNRKNLRTKL
ncbi:hypothetical protein MKX54_20355 [Alkalihalobacillus sp. FSL R5-0424]